MRLAKECKVAIIEKTYDGGVCLPERSANMSLRGKLVVFWMKHRPRHIATTQMVALMFAAIILLGALLLTLPAASRDGVSCGLRPALFTATSATCVTGLVLYDTWSQWSGFGQVVILCLIQIGGLGFMSVATLLIFLLRRKIGLQQRLMIAQSLSVNDIKGVVRLQKLVLIGSFSVEAVGAIILTLRFWPEYGFTRALRWGIFHSVSAFCNAGFDIFGAIAPGQSLIEFNADPVVLLTLSALIIIGGLGFLVWENIVQKRSFGKFSVYARMVLLMTAALLAVGWVGTCLLEWNNPETLGGMTVGEKLLNGFFQSATLRTAGFAAIDQAKLTESGKAFSCVLMSIGGSSGSTAGGLKTVTFVVLVLFLAARARGKSRVCVFQRTIPQGQVLDAMTLGFLMIALTLLGGVFLSITSPISYTDALYETASALGTVGLTAGATGRLCQASQILIIIFMYFGRVGLLTISMGFLAGNKAEERFRYAETNLLIG